MAARGDSEGSVYQIKSGPDAGKWRGAVVVGWRADGRPDRRTVKRATEPEARRALRQLLNARDTGRLRKAASDWLVEDWCWHWLHHLWSAQRDHRDATQAAYESALRTWVGPTLGRVRLDRVRDEHMARLLREIDRAGRGAATKRHAHLVLTMALDAAVAAGLLGHNPVQVTRPPAALRKPIRPPDDDDVTAVYRAVHGTPDEPRILIALALGLRQGEALGLDWGRDVDLGARLLRVQRQLRRLRGRHGCGRRSGEDGRWPCGHVWAAKCPTGTAGLLTLEAVKTDAGRRTLPIPPQLVDVLAAHRRRADLDRQAHLTRGPWRTVWDGRVEDFNLVFCQPLTGRPVDPHSDWRRWHEILQAAGLEAAADGGVQDRRHRLHDARHAAAVGMIDSGLELSVVTRMLGHTSQSFTHSTYGHWSPEQARRADEAISGRLARMMDAKDDLAARRRRDRPDTA